MEGVRILVPLVRNSRAISGYFLLDQAFGTRLLLKQALLGSDSTGTGGDKKGEEISQECFLLNSQMQPDSIGFWKV